LIFSALTEVCADTGVDPTLKSMTNNTVTAITKPPRSFH
jgi:hypothetical protein